MQSFNCCCDEMGDRLASFDFMAQYVLTDGPDGTVKFVEQIKGGRMAYVGIGEASAPDFVLSMTHADYRRTVDLLMSSHQLESCRAEGNLTKLEPAIVVRGSPEYRRHKERTRDFTRWS
jgi:hypothetical protein